MTFKPGQSGNPAGRPKGVFQRHAQLGKLIRDQGDSIINKCMEMAFNGDPTCMKICMDRVVPPLKKDALDFQIPDLTDKNPEQLTEIMFQAMSGQLMSADEINCILNMIKTFRSNDDASSMKEFIDKSNAVLEELRVKNEREY